MRGGGVMEAATKMRNNNEYPVTVLADKDTPFKKKLEQLHFDWMDFLRSLPSGGRGH